VCRGLHLARSVYLGWRAPRVSVDPTALAAYVELERGPRVLALIAPTKIEMAEIRSVCTVAAGECVEGGPPSGAVTLDG
jgi:hypothetical protein